MGKGRGKAMPVSDVPRSAGEIHLPQLLNEEAIADEFTVKLYFRLAKKAQTSPITIFRFFYKLGW